MARFILLRYALIITGSAVCILCWLDIRLWHQMPDISRIMCLCGILLVFGGCILEVLFYGREKQELEKENIPFNPERPIVKLLQDACDSKKLCFIFLATAVIGLGLHIFAPEWRDPAGEIGQVALLLSVAFHFLGKSFEKEVLFCLGDYE